MLILSVKHMFVWSGHKDKSYYFQKKFSGGLTAVIYTDTLQAALMVGGSLVLTGIGG